MLRTLLILAFACRAVAAPAPVKLEYRANPAPVKYAISTRERTERAGFATPPAGKPVHFYKTSELVQQSVKQAGVLLECHVQPLAKTMDVDATPVRGVKFPTTPIVYRMDARGKRDGDGDDVAYGLAPLLPEAPVSPGHEWTVKVPPSKKFGHPLDVTHRFEAVETFQGERCALIKSRAKLVAKDADIAFSLDVTSAMYLSLDSGQMLRSSSITSFNTKALKGFKGGHSIVLRGIQREVQRQLK